MVELQRDPADPVGAHGRHVVLFVDRRRAEAAAIEARFLAVRWPVGAAPTVVDLATDRTSAEWYGIRRGPVVAVVCNGSLLALEHECGPESCARVWALANRRDLRAFEGLA